MKEEARTYREQARTNIARTDTNSSINTKENKHKILRKTKFYIMEREAA